MKKFRILRGALSLAVVIVFIVVACNKESTITMNESEVMLISKEDDMNAYLKQFKEKMQSAKKSDETLSMEDARWHLEAVLNYTYGDAGYQTSDIQCDTLFYTLCVDSEGITLLQLNEAFDFLSCEVEKTYNNCNLPDKSVLAVQTSFENESKNNDEIVVRTVISIRGYHLTSMGFDSTDYWNEWYYDYGDGYVYSGGKCGPYSGNCLESGAPLELTRKLNLRIPAYSCSYRGGYFTDTEQIVLSRYSFNYYPYDDFVYDENSPCHYKIYYRNEDPHEPWASNPGGCICPEDMNYYLGKGLQLINHYCPLGKDIIGAYYQSDVLVGIDSRDDNCFHELVIEYGVFHCNDAGAGND